ncbi:hypothetical protein H2200_003011 [Cladophialophora chaetospira]|uniref:Major facilitator superfamily (MFS) profile domain-containing protein n=1 Tax=Cladophialophora chaetospira TaxID=386627 RepID=A0AA39CLW1_9EURO|nr:hypothetical protein H2200_003011 [Cladophialophora chaetospira]
MAKKKRNPYNVLIVAFVALGSFAFGYSNTIIGTTLAQPSFNSYFGLDKPNSNRNEIAGATNGIYTGGGLLGALFASWSAERLGRKKSIFIGALLATVGGALQAGCPQHIAAFLVFRFINGLGVVISQERSDEALKIVQRLHRDETDPNDVFAFREYQQMKQQFEIDKNNEVSWGEMFAKSSYRKRLIIGAIVMFGSQTTGTTVIANYGPELYRALGFGTTIQLPLSGLYATLALCGNFFNAFTIDHIGRVNALKIGWIGDAVALIGECASLSTFERTGSHSAAVASVFFLFLHIFLFAFNIDVTTYVYTSEIFPNHIRAKGMGASIVAYWSSLLIYLEVAPTAFADIGWKFYLVFLSLLICFIIPLFFYFPESKGLSLEEVARLFNDEITSVRLDAMEVSGDEKMEIVLERERIAQLKQAPLLT